MNRHLNALTLVAGLLIAGVSFVSAQTPAQDARVGPHVKLTQAQRQTLYQSIVSTQKNQAAPIGFRVSIGGTVPPGIDLVPVPDTIVGLAPQLGRLEVAMIEKQVVLVEPQSRQIAAVIRGEP